MLKKELESQAGKKQEIQNSTPSNIPLKSLAKMTISKGQVIGYFS